MIAAILRAQFLSMRFGRGSIFAIIAGVIWYGLWCVAGVAAYLMTCFSNVETLRVILPLGLAGVCAYWQLFPMVSASLGASLDMRKLRAYPIPHRHLFFVEVLLRLTTAIEMLIVLVGGGIGLARNPEIGGFAAIPRTVLGLLLLIAFNLLLASGLRSILERLMARRRVREVLAVLMAMVWVLPRFLFSNGVRPKSFDGPWRWVQTLALPWTAAANAALGYSEGLSLLCLAGWIVLAFWFGRSQFERSLRYDAIAAQATPDRATNNRRDALWERFFRWPSLLWRDPLAAIIEKELRSLARTPRFRMVFVMGFTFGLMVWFPVVASRRGAMSTSSSPYFLVVVSVYALTLLGQVSYWNCFGFDRSAAAFYLAVPQPLKRVFMGKNIAALIFIYLEVVIVAGVTMALGLAGGWWRVFEALLVVGICAPYMLALGNLSSVRYPRAANPERVSQGGGSGKQGLLFLLYPLSLAPVFLAYLTRYAFDSEMAFLIALAIAAIIGGTMYVMAMETAVSDVVRKREAFLGELSKGDGPVVST